MNLPENTYREYLRYDAETGKFFWQKSSCNRIVPGVEAGSDNGAGYICIWLFGVKVRAHRLAWLFAYHEWPNGDLDHINGRRSDNRIDNLRIVDRHQNMQNMLYIKENGLPSGITLYPARYAVRISGALIDSFGSKEEAIGCLIKEGRKIKGKDWADRVASATNESSNIGYIIRAPWSPRENPA